MAKKQISKRRQFLKNVATLGTLAFFDPQNVSAVPGEDINDVKDINFLFQGDSITDGNRSRNNDWNHVMGHGFAYLISSRLWCDFPKKGFHFFNRGISGNKVPDLV